MKTLLLIIFTLNSMSGHADDSKGEQVPRIFRDIIAIKIPKIAAEDATLVELIDFAALRIKELDSRQPGPSGISFLTSGFSRPDDATGDLLSAPAPLEKKVSYEGEDVRVDSLLTDLAGMFEVEFHVTSVGVIITPKNGNAFPNSKAKKGKIYYIYKSKSEQAVGGKCSEG